MSTHGTVPTQSDAPPKAPATGTRTRVRQSILELAARGGCDHHQVDALLEDWVQALMSDALKEYGRLFKEHWPDDGDDELVPREFRTYVNNWLNGTRSPHRSPRTPDWPWPITDIIPTRHPGLPDFQREMSALRACGYSVGKSSDMTDAVRRRFLAYFFTQQLPRRIHDAYGEEYGEPRSEYRLQKMANVIASACRNAKRRRDGADFAVAISDWEMDLAFLKAEFYDGLWGFDWPSTLA